jgi:hypothetical protein
MDFFGGFLGTYPTAVPSSGYLVWECRRMENVSLVRGLAHNVLKLLDSVRIKKVPSALLISSLRAFMLSR